MKQRIILVGCGLCLLIGWLVFFGSQVQLASAKSGFQDSSCDELLTRILERAGWGQINQPHNSCEYLGVGSNFYATAGLSIDPSDGPPYVIRSCGENTVPGCSESTFHGYPAITAVSNGTGSIGWTMPRGNTEYRFYVFMGEGYDVMEFADELVAAAEQELPAAGSFEPEPTLSATEVVLSNSDCSGVTPDALREGGLTVLKCRLHCDPNIMSDEELKVCIDQFSGQTSNGSDPQDPNGITPPDNIPDGETLPPSGSIPDAEIIIPPDDTAGSNPSKQLGPIATTPWIPLAGGVVGTMIGWLVSVAVTSGNLMKTPPSRPVRPPTNPGNLPIGSTNNQELYWSERPWDEAGPGYVSKMEYERTKSMLEQGYKWTKDGWQTPDQIRQSVEWQKNNRAATDSEEAAWRSQVERERQALEQNKADLKKKADELQAKSNMLDLGDDFRSINQGLLEEKIYVANPYQGDPTVIVYGLNTLKNVIWDKTAGVFTGSHGLTCEGYVEKTSDKVVEAVKKRFPGAKVQNMIFEEKSTVNTDKGILDMLDSVIDDNHNLIKIILPDESEWALDFHQYNAGKSPLLRPWSEARHAWKEDYMGDEFVERVRRSIQIDPKPSR